MGILPQHRQFPRLPKAGICAAPLNPLHPCQNCGRPVHGDYGRHFQYLWRHYANCNVLAGRQHLHSGNAPGRDRGRHRGLRLLDSIPYGSFRCWGRCSSRSCRSFCCLPFTGAFSSFICSLRWLRCLCHPLPEKEQTPAARRLSRAISAFAWRAQSSSLRTLFTRRFFPAASPPWAPLCPPSQWRWSTSVSSFSTC